MPTPDHPRESPPSTVHDSSWTLKNPDAARDVSVRRPEWTPVEPIARKGRGEGTMAKKFSVERPSFLYN